MDIAAKNTCVQLSKREGLGYFQFIKLLHVGQKHLEDNGKIYYGFKIRPDGVYMLPPDHDYHQWSHDQEGFFEGFDVHDLEKTPVLAFPCTDSELKIFLQKSGLDGMVDPDELAAINDTYDFGCPTDWLRRKYLSAKEGLLLLAGLNPKVIHGVDWSPSGDFYCTLNHAERLNYWGNPYTGHALYSRKQLDDIKKILDNEASAIVASATEAIRTAPTEGEDGPLVPPPLPTITEYRDNENYEACNRWLKYYNESEKLLDFFITRWLDIPRNLDETGIETCFFSRWVYDTGIYSQVPWWSKAVELGLVKEDGFQQQPSAPVAPQDGTVSEYQRKVLDFSEELICLEDASSVTGKTKQTLLSDIASGNLEAYTFFINAEVNFGTFPIQPAPSNHGLHWPAGEHKPFATTLPLEAVRTLKFYPETIDVEGYAFPQRTPIKLEGYHIDLLRTGKTAAIEYGFLPDGRGFKVVNPGGGLLVTADGLFIRKGDLSPQQAQSSPVVALPTTGESAEKMAERLRAEGKGEIELTAELLTRFPGTTNNRLCYLVRPEYADTVGESMRKKTGLKLARAAGFRIKE